MLHPGSLQNSGKTSLCAWASSCTLRVYSRVKRREQPEWRQEYRRRVWLAVAVSAVGKLWGFIPCCSTDEALGVLGGVEGVFSLPRSGELALEGNRDEESEALENS